MHGVRALAVAVLLLMAAPAVAQEPEISFVADPARAGAQSTLRFDSRGGSAASGAATPDSITIALQRGFRVDLRGAAGRCSDEQAREACPDAARVGRGEATIRAEGLVVPGGSQSFRASIEAFLAPARKDDLAGVVIEIREPQTSTFRSARGRLVTVPDGPYGHELIFSDFGAAPTAPPGVTITLERLTLSVGARRTGTVTRRVRGRRVRRKVTRSLITNPRVCPPAGWAAQLRVVANGAETVRTVAAPCRAR